MPSIIALDLDGTLLNSHKEITPRTLAALIRQQEQGATLVIASGRPVCGSAPFVRQLALRQHKGFVIAFNGAEILECATNKILYENTLPTDVLPTIHSLSKHPTCTMLTYVNDIIVTEDATNPHVQYAAHINRMTIRETDSLLHVVNHPVPKCIIAGEATELDMLEEKVRMLTSPLPLTIVRSEPFFLEFMPQGVNKGAALARLLALTGHSTDDLTAFGDSYNDATMLSLAGTAVAMQNARPEIRAMAHVVTASNDDDGVARYLESLE